MKANMPLLTNEATNDLYTYVTLPVEALSTVGDQQGEPFTVTHNLILKTLPDGTMCIVDANQLLPDHNLPAYTVNETISIENIERPSVIEPNELSDFRQPVKLKSITVKQDDVAANESQVKHPNSKLVEFNPKPSQQKNSRNPPSQLFKCSLCGEMLFKMTQYRKHMQVHRDTRKYKCEFCSASYNVIENFTLHMAMHTKGVPTCPVCNRIFQRLASLKAHLVYHQVEETFTCTECLAEYDKEDEFYKHMETHKNEIIVRKSPSLSMVCSYCNHSFQDATEFKEHIAYHIQLKKLVFNSKPYKRRSRSGKQLRYKCDVCGKSFAKGCLLDRHLRIHSGEKPFACSICERAFSQKGTLQIHLFRHSGLKPYACTLCPAKFCQKGNLRVHVEKTHMTPIPGENMYKCTMCSCMFKKVATLNAHITKVHARDKQDDLITIMSQLKELEKKVSNRNIKDKDDNSGVINDFLGLGTEPSTAVLDEFDSSLKYRYVKVGDSSVDGSLRRYFIKQRKDGDIRWYMCSFCIKEFKKPSDLIRHIRIHTRERPFKCKQCGQRFTVKSTLVTHLNTHLGRKQYQCTTCLKMFISLRALTAHLRKLDSNDKLLCASTSRAVPSDSEAKINIVFKQKQSELKQTGDNSQVGIEVVMKQPMLETVDGLLPVAAPKSRVTSENDETNKARPHKCHICNSAFKTAVHVKRHLLIHSGEKSHKCDSCTKSFYTAYALREHQKFHMGIKNFICKVCNKRFVTNSLLKRHVLTHSPKKPYVCPYCSKKFKSVLLCRKHILIHKRDIKMQIHALHETGEIANLKETDTAKIIDFAETLSDDPFSIQSLTNENEQIHLAPNNLPSENTVENVNTLPVSPMIHTNSTRTNIRAQKNSFADCTPKVLYTDETGVILSASVESLSQSNLNELLETANHSVTEIARDSIPSYAENRTSISVALPTADSGIMDTAEVSQNLQDCSSSSYPAIYINCEDLQNLSTSNLYANYLSQLKNNDALLLSEINEEQDSNILFSIDPALTEINEHPEAQPYEALPTADINIPLENLLLSSFNNDNNQVTHSSLLPNINELNKNTLNLNTHTNHANRLFFKSPLINGIRSAANQNSTMLVLDGEHFLKSDIDLNLFNLHFNSNNNTQNTKLPVTTVNVLDAQACLDVSNLQRNAMEPTASASSTVNLYNTVNVSNRGLSGLLSEEPNKNLVENGNSGTSGDDISKLLECEEISVFKNKKKIPRKLSKKSRKTKSKSARKSQQSKQKNMELSEVLSIESKNTCPENTCTYCEKYFKKPSDLTRHIRTHTGERPFTCKECNKSFSLKSTLASHYKTHNPGSTKDYNCSVCNSNFCSKASLKLHTLLHTGVKRFQCPLCPLRFRTSGHLKSHLLKHVSSTGPKKQLSKNVKVQNLFASVIMDPINEEPNEQSTVMPLTDTTQILQDITQQPSKEIPETNASIQIHPLLFQQLQLGEVFLPENTDRLSSFIQLDIDGSVQISNIQPVVHVETATTSSINANDVTNYQEAYENGLLDEKTTKQIADLLANSKSRNFECDICQKRYNTKAILQKHVKIHGSKNGLRCEICKKTFELEEELENHLKLHAGYRPFSCQLCTNSFSLESSLKTHMKRIHK